MCSFAFSSRRKISCLQRTFSPPRASERVQKAKDDLIRVKGTASPFSFFFPRGIRSLSIEEIRLDPLGAEESVIMLFRAIFKCERKSFNFALFDYPYEMKIEPIQAQNRYHFSFVETNFLFSKYDAVFLRTDPIPRSHSRRSINKQVDRQNSVDYLAGC